MSSYDWFGSQIAFPLGLAIAGPLIDALAIRPTLILLGAVCVISILGLLLVPDVRNLTNTPTPEPSDPTT